MSRDNYSKSSVMPSPPPSPLIANPGLHCSVTDLSRQLEDHSLESRQKRPVTPALSTPPSELSDSASCSVFSTTSPFGSPAFSDLSSQPSSLDSEPPRRSRSPPLAYSNYHTSNVRRSRQDAIRAQCSSSHLHEISLLVARMVDSGEQCTVCAPQDMASNLQPVTDEPAQMESDMDLDMSEDDGDNNENDRPRSSYGKSVHTTPSTSRRTSAVGSAGGKDNQFCVSKQRPAPATRRRTTLTTLTKRRTT